MGMKRWIQQLKAEEHKQDYDPENLTGPSLRQPALDPRENHPRQQKVEKPEESQGRGDPEHQLRARDHDTYPYPQHAHAAEQRRRIEEPEEEVKQRIGAKANREAQQKVEVDALLRGGEHHRNHLPHKEDRPQQCGKKDELVVAGDLIGQHAAADSHPKPNRREKSRGEDVRAQFKFTRLGAK